MRRITRMNCFIDEYVFISCNDMTTKKTKRNLEKHYKEIWSREFRKIYMMT